MVHKKKPTRGKRRYKGICAFADSYGVTHQHARRVADGYRSSPNLLLSFMRKLPEHIPTLLTNNPDGVAEMLAGGRCDKGLLVDLMQQHPEHMPYFVALNPHALDILMEATR